MNHRRVIIALLCSLLIVSAGCASFTSNDAESTTPPTTEPATTTAEPTTTTEPTDGGTTESADQLAPGLTTDGVTDALALANAHRDALTNGPFVSHTVVEESNASASASHRETLHYANESHWLWNITTNGMPLALGATNGTFVSYADGEKVVYRLQADGNVTHNVRRISARADAPPVPPADVLPESVYARDFVYTLFGNADVTVEDSDRATTRLTGTADELGIGGQTATDVEFTANITEGGLVRTLDLTYQQGNATVERSLSFEETDESPVERPDWYETALNQTSGE